jgi:hypothetical protein
VVAAAIRIPAADRPMRPHLLEARGHAGLGDGRIAEAAGQVVSAAIRDGRRLLSALRFACVNPNCDGTYSNDDGDGQNSRATSIGKFQAKTPADAIAPEAQLPFLGRSQSGAFK